MGQGQSSSGFGSTDETTTTTTAAGGVMIMPEDVATPDLLTDRVRQCLRSTDDDGVMLAASASSGGMITSPSPAIAKDVEPVPAVFTWTHGGQHVFITGSFNQWSGKIPMQRSAKDFTVILQLPPGTIDYKFIVDDQWRYAPDQPTVTDAQGVVNNQIEIRAASQTDPTFNYFDDQDGNDEYGQVEPVAADYTKDPPPLPPHLGIILLNSEEIAGQNDAVMLPVPQHVTLNHMYISKSEAQEVCVMGMTQRYNNKFVTTVYYRPSPDVSPDGTALHAPLFRLRD